MLAINVYQEVASPFRINVALNPTDTLLAQGTGIRNRDRQVAGSGLSAYPNPFADRVMISFDLPEEDHVRLDLYDLGGRLVRQILDERRPSGRNVIHYPASEIEGGAYILKLEYGGGILFTSVIKSPGI